jgi:hypothetical protein
MKVNVGRAFRQARELDQRFRVGQTAISRYQPTPRHEGESMRKEGHPRDLARHRVKPRTPQSPAPELIAVHESHRFVARSATHTGLLRLLRS